MFPFLDPCDEPNTVGAIGPYLIEQLIGEGATSYVFAGRDSKLQRQVAVRVLKPALADSQEARAHFLSENRAASRVEHPNVLPVYDLCEDSDCPYAVLAHSEGQSLGDLIDHEGPLLFEEVRRLALAITDGLQAIHNAGYVHGDLKPDNVLLNDSTQTVWLSDFGGMKDHQATTCYAAPEQIDHADSDHRADLFSLGVLLYQMASGELPYQSTRSVSLANEIMLLPTPSMAHSSCPLWFQRLVACLLEKAPEDRPCSAREVEKALNSQRFGHKPILKRWQMFSTVALALALIGAVLAYPYQFQETSSTPSISIRGTGMGFDRLADAISAAPADAILELQDGVYELDAAVRITRPIRIVAAKSARPVIRSLDTDVGRIFWLEAPTTLEGLTLSHQLSGPSSKSLIYARAPLSAIHCRFEQLWKNEPKVSPMCSVIISYSAVTLESTEIDATSGCAITSSLSAENQPVIDLTLSSCAIAAVRGIYLSSKVAARGWNISLTNCNMIAGGVFCVDIQGRSIPHWKLEHSVIDCARMLMVRGPWQRFAENVLPHVSWQGRHNVYAATEFLYPWEGGPNDDRWLQSLPGWKTLCPQAEEIDTLESADPLMLTFLPEDYRELRSEFLHMPPFSAQGLQLRPEMAAKFPGRGGDMSRVGPIAE